MSYDDGATVSYIGMPQQFGLGLGDKGIVLESAGRGSHVKWATGALTGQISIVDNYDIALLGQKQPYDSLDDSLEMGTLSMTGVLATYDEEGPAGVLNEMATAGRLDAFTGIAHEALGLIQTRIRHDPAIAAVLAQLGEEEADALVTLASTVLIRDAFGVEVEG